MKTTKLTCLAIGLSMISTAPFALAQKPADKTTPERKMTADDPAKVVVVSPAAEEHPALLDRPPIVPGSLSAMIGDSVTFATLKKALVAADLDAILGTTAIYTILAPTDEAFGKLPAGTVDKLLMPQNKEKLRSLLLYHVIAGQMLAKDFKEGEVTTMNGEKVKVEVEDGKIEVDDSKVYSTDVMAKNGVMHSIGKVLVPKSMEDFAGLDR